MNIYKKALLLAVPMMIQQGITNAVGLVDNVMVGSLGTESITAVSIVTQLIFVYSLAVFGGLSGPGIFGAQYYGYGDTEGVRMTFRIKIWIGAFCVALGFLVLWFGGSGIIGMFLKGEGGNIDSALTLGLARDYLRIMLIGMVPFTFAQIYYSTLRETDDSFKPMIAGISSVVTDVLFNYILIFGKFGFPAMGVKGAAIATSLSRIVELFVIIIWAHRKKEDHEFLIGIYRTLMVPMEKLKSIVLKSLPIFINEFLWAGGLAVLTQCYSLRGLIFVAGLNISNVICNLLNVGFVSLGAAVGIIVGQTLGAGETEKAYVDAVKLIKFSLGFSLVFTLVLFIIAPVFPNIYNTSEDVKHLARIFIFITAAFFPVQSLLNALYFVIRAGGKTVITFLFDSGFSWLISVPIAYILCLKTGISTIAIYSIILSLDIIKVVVGIVMVKGKVWITNLVG